MKKILLQLTLGIFLSLNLYSQDLQIFSLSQQEFSGDQSILYTSLSDIYIPSSNPDSAAIPLHLLGKEPDTVYPVITLDSNFRALFLACTDLREKDNLYLFDAIHAKTKIIPIHKLKSVAVLSVYYSGYYGSVEANDYQIGFEIDPALLAEDGSNFILIALGQESPFAEKPLSPIIWEAISPSSDPILQDYLSNDSLTRINFINTHRFNIQNFSYYLAEDDDHLLNARKLCIYDCENKTWIFDHNFLEGESASHTPIITTPNTDPRFVYQWTGNFFKNEPAMIFGMQYQSFGCPSFFSIEKQSQETIMNCDNRH